MPQNLDEETRKIVIHVTTFTTAVVGAFGLFALRIVMPRLRRSLAKNGINVASAFKDRHHPSLLQLIRWCLATLSWMAAGTFILTALILSLLGSPSQTGDEPDEQHNSYTSSINFCEPDFKDTDLIAEPVNTISSLICYIPLSVLGLLNPPHSYESIFSYLTLFAIGLGSTALHALLTAYAQGGDELPMLWFCAAAVNIVCHILFSGYRGLGQTPPKTLTLAVTVSAAVATAIYVFSRDNFVFFYVMFSLYAQVIIIGFLVICFLLPWNKHESCGPKRLRQVDSFRVNILMPLALCTGGTIIVAMWTWVSEMLFCTSATQEFKFGILFAPFFWHRCVHALWHMTSGLLAWLVLQVLLATRGMQQERGAPELVWRGAPYVRFIDEDKKE